MNTRNSSIKGKAYEYACVLALQEIITPIRNIELEQNESLRIAKSRYENDIASEEKSEMLLSAKAGIETIIDMEPKIIEDGKDTLTVCKRPRQCLQFYLHIKFGLLYLNFFLSWIASP